MSDKIYDAIETLNDVKDTFSFVHFDEESTKGDALVTIQDCFEIIKACQDVIELLSEQYLGEIK